MEVGGVQRKEFQFTDIATAEKQIDWEIGGEGEDSKIKVRISKWHGERRYNMTLDEELFDQLTVKAKASPKLRINFDLRDSADDVSQRMLNAIEPGTVLPIHRHRESSETVVMLRGKGRWNYYDDYGNLTGSFLLSSDGDLRGLSVPKGQWHNAESLETGTVILECKDGAWQPLAPEDIMEI